MSRSVESAQQNALFSCKGSPGSPICDYWTISGLLFLPAPGTRLGSSVSSHGVLGAYLTLEGTEYASQPIAVRRLYLSVASVGVGIGDRILGQSVRLVCLAQ